MTAQDRMEALDFKSYENSGDFLRFCSLYHRRDEAIQAVAIATKDCIERTGKGLVLREADLSGLDLSGFDLQGAVLNRASLHSSNLAGANLKNAALICTGLERTNFQNANLEGVYVHAFAAQVCDFRNANMSNMADATGGLFHGCKLSGTDFSNSVLAGTAFYQCEMSKSIFSYCNLQGVTFNESDMSGANLDCAEISQISFVKCHANEMSLRNAQGDSANFQRMIGCDNMVLDNASLPYLRLFKVRGTNISARGLAAKNAQISACSLNNACLDHADFRMSSWSEVNLTGSSAHNVKLADAMLNNVDMTRLKAKRLRGEQVKVVECKLSEADLEGFAGRSAMFRDCSMNNVNMAGAYLYRGIFTGDPINGMSLRESNFKNAILVQAYIAADMSNANMTGVAAAYSRMNQTSLRDADLNGMGLYGGSFVKTDFSDAKFGDVVVPFFADRSSGLLEALKDNKEAAEYIEKLQELVKKASYRGST